MSRCLLFVSALFASLCVLAQPSFAQFRGGFDPAMIFDQLAKGRGYVTLDDARDAESRERWQTFMQKAGVTDGKFTKEHFLKYMEERRASGAFSGRSFGGPPSGGVPTGSPFGGAPSNPVATPSTTPSVTPSTPTPSAPPAPRDLDAESRRYFSYRDRNGDGLLNFDEVSDTLRSELPTWDKNQDSFIDLNEYTEFYKAFIAKQQVIEASQQPTGYQSGYTQPSATPVPEEVKKPTVFRIDKLPKEIPSWFKEMDANLDGQVALYEWKQKEKADSEFLALDRNNDGFITVEEVLFSIALAKTAKAGETASTSGLSAYARPGSSNSGPSSSSSGDSRDRGRFGGSWPPSGGSSRDSRGSSDSKDSRDSRSKR